MTPIEKPKLLQPITIRGMRLKNRIAYAPMLCPGFANDDGSVSGRNMRWYEDRVKGGIGFVMSESILPYTPTKIGTIFALDIDENIPGFAKLVDMIHSHDVKVCAQVAEAGETFALAAALGMPIEMLLPSVLPQEKVAAGFKKCLPTFPPEIKVREPSIEEIKAIEESFVACAKRVKEAGFDAIEIHSAHGTLHSAFLSPHYNKRTDEYGGSWENRMRFLLETIELMRKTVGDFPIFVRISADELLTEEGERGIHIEETCKIVAPRLEEAGVDCLDVSAGLIATTPQGITVPLYYPRGCWVHYAEMVKKAVNIPVIGVGRINDMKLAEKYVEEERVDIIYMGRQIICDPETPRKYMEGRLEDIRMCLGCLEGTQGCTTCGINFDAGREGDFPIKPAEKPKRVLVVGGGVAGMEAARIAAIRGHQVTLYERDGKLGGTVLIASEEPLKRELRNIVNYLQVQVKKLPVKIELGKEVTPELVGKIKPDTVIFATGASPRVPKIARGKPNVFVQDDFLTKKPEPGKRVVVWGIATGAETAIALAKRGRKVTLVGSSDMVAPHLVLTIGRRYYILRTIEELGIEVLTTTKVEDITSEGVVVSKDGKKRTIPADTVIVAVGRKPNRDLIEVLKGKLPECYEIGDCARPANIASAITTANEVARRI